jgi:outer membrane lipoprotein-sorting protein
MTYTKFKPAFGISGATIMLAGAMTVIFSSAVAGDDLSPSQIFKQTQENYASLASYSDEGQTVSTMNDTTTTTTFTIRLARTNFYRIEWEQNSKSSCSTRNTSVQAVWSSGAGDFLEVGCGAQEQYDREIALADAAAFSGGAAATIPRIFFKMQSEDQFEDSMLSEKRQADEEVGDVNCYVFTRESQGQTNTLWIGKQDFLIRQVRTVTSAEAMRAEMARAAKGDPEIISPLHGFTSTETHTNIVVNKQFLRLDFVPSFSFFNNE